MFYWWCRLLFTSSKWAIYYGVLTTYTFTGNYTVLGENLLSILWRVLWFLSISCMCVSVWVHVLCVGTGVSLGRCVWVGVWIQGNPLVSSENHRICWKTWSIAQPIIYEYDPVNDLPIIVTLLWSFTHTDIKYIHNKSNTSICHSLTPSHHLAWLQSPDSDITDQGLTLVHLKWHNLLTKLDFGPLTAT